MGIEKKKEETKQITKRLPTAIIYFGLSARTKFKKKDKKKKEILGVIFFPSTKAFGSRQRGIMISFLGLNKA